MLTKNLLDCLRLIRSPGIGCLTYFSLVREHGSEGSALQFLSRQGKETFSEKEAVTEIKAHEKHEAFFLTHYDAEYPQLLKHIGDYPPVLSVLGKSDVLNKPMIGIVGARNASLHATKFAQNLARRLCEAGYSIVSGLARGIDGAAHKGAIDAMTVAIVAGGIDQIYPTEHKDLRSKILEKGAIISEMPFGLFPGAGHFPRRNRLISGLSQAICVIEAAKPSGSLITASYALDQGRELFAVPGFPGDQRSIGTNHLIKQGAHVLEGVEDILNILGTSQQTTTSLRGTIEEGLETNDTLNGNLANGLKKKILESLSTHPLSPEELFSVLDEEVRDIHATLLSLELQGHITRDQRGYLARVF